MFLVEFFVVFFIDICFFSFDSTHKLNILNNTAKIRAMKPTNAPGVEPGLIDPMCLRRQRTIANLIFIFIKPTRYPPFSLKTRYSTPSRTI